MAMAQSSTRVLCLSPVKRTPATGLSHTRHLAIEHSTVFSICVRIKDSRKPVLR